VGPPHTGFVLSDRGAVPATDRFERRMRTVQKSIDPMSSMNDARTADMNED